MSAAFELLDLNLKSVDYYRRVRDGLPTTDYAEARRKIIAIRSLAKQLDEQMARFTELTAELYNMHIGRTPCGLELAMFHVAEQPGHWTKPRNAVHHKKSQEEWNERPTTKQALHAWNQFITALQKKPERIYRVTPKGINDWAAEYRRTDGSTMFVTLSELTGDPPGPETCGMTGAGSFGRILDEMLAWIDMQEQTS